MCIICIKPAGGKLPSKECRKNMWDNNSDGAGIMWNEGGRVHIEKGFMTFSHMENRITELGDMTNKTVVLHYRITTHGGTKAENCHPFPISEHLSILQKPIINTDIGMAHNGIISAVTPGKDISDTMEYILTQLSIMKRIDHEFYLKKTWLEMIKNIIDSKMVFLDSRGHFETIGEFREEGDCLYSNTSYEPRTYYSKYDLACYGDWSDYDDYGDGYEYKRVMDLDAWSVANDGYYQIIDQRTGEETDNVFDYVWYMSTCGDIYKYDPDFDFCVYCDYLTAMNMATREKIEYQDDLSEYILAAE